MEKVFSDGTAFSNQGNESPTEDSSSSSCEDVNTEMQQLSTVARAVTDATNQDVANQDLEQQTCETAVSGGEFVGAQIGTKHIYNVSRNDTTNTFHFHATETHRVPIVGDPEEGASGGKKDKKPDYIHLCDFIRMFPKKEIAATKHIYYGERISKLHDPQPIAIKYLKYNEKFLRETKIALKLPRHQNLVSVIHSDIYNHDRFDYMYIAMELCHEQNLHDHVFANKRNNIPFDSQLSISQAKQLVDGLNFIHGNKIIHRDLKPYNVLLSLDKKTLKIADFGISKEMTRGRTVTNVTNARVGTDGYRAPETYNKNSISLKTDIFSLGLVFFFLWSNGCHAFGDDADDWNSNIKKDKHRDLSTLQVEDEEEMATDLLQWMLQFVPEKRPTTAQILNHKIFGGCLVSPGAETLPTGPPIGVDTERGPSVIKPASEETVPSSPPDENLPPKETEDKEDNLQSANPTQEFDRLIPKPLGGGARRKEKVTETKTDGEGGEVQQRGPIPVPRKSLLVPPSPNEMINQMSERSEEVQQRSPIPSTERPLPDPPQLYQQPPDDEENMYDIPGPNNDCIQTRLNITEARINDALPCEDAMSEVISTCRALEKSPEDMESIAKHYLEDLKFPGNIYHLVRAYIMYFCASKMYKTDCTPTHALNGITECNLQIKEVAARMVKISESRIVKEYVLPSMDAMLRDLQEITDPDFVVAEALSMYNIGLSYEKVMKHREAFVQFRHGIELMDRELRHDAYKYKVHGQLLHCCGVANLYLGNLTDAKDCFRKSITSKQRSEDFSHELSRDESLKNTKDKLQEAERMTDSSSKPEEPRQFIVPERSNEVYAKWTATYTSLFKQCDSEKDSLSKLKILQQMAECQVKCEHTFWPDLVQIIEVCEELNYSPHVLSNSLAREQLDKSSYVAAYVMYVAASKMYRKNSRSEKCTNIAAVKGISSCIYQLHKILNKLLTKAVTKKIALIQVIPSMDEMLKELQEVKELDRAKKVVIEATFLTRMGRVYQKVGIEAGAHDHYKRALNIMQKGIGMNCSKHKIYGGLLHNIGIVYEVEREYAQAIRNYEQSIKAKEDANDYKDPEEKKRNIENTRRALQSCEQELNNIDQFGQEHVYMALDVGKLPGEREQTQQEQEDLGYINCPPPDVTLPKRNEKVKKKKKVSFWQKRVKGKTQQAKPDDGYEQMESTYYSNPPQPIPEDGYEVAAFSDVYGE